MPINSVSSQFVTIQPVTREPGQNQGRQLTPEERNNRVDQTIETRNDVQNNREQAQTDTRTQVFDIAEQQTVQRNAETYANAYSNATGGESSGSSGSPSLSDVQEISQTLNRSQAIQSGTPQEIAQARQERSDNLYGPGGQPQRGPSDAIFRTTA